MSSLLQFGGLTREAVLSRVETLGDRLEQIAVSTPMGVLSAQEHCLIIRAMHMMYVIVDGPAIDCFKECCTTLREGEREVSSLLQFGGDIRRNPRTGCGEVGLLFALIHKEWVDTTSPLNSRSICECGSPQFLHEEYGNGPIQQDSSGYSRAIVTDPEYLARVPGWQQENPCKAFTIKKYGYFNAVDVEPVELVWGEKTHKVPRLYRAWRKPCGMFGQWVVFRYNGEEHAPDLSVPISVEKLPRDAKPLSDEEAIRYWSTP